jgi:hypothetical protein
MVSSDRDVTLLPQQTLYHGIQSPGHLLPAQCCRSAAKAALDAIRHAENDIFALYLVLAFEFESVREQSSLCCCQPQTTAVQGCDSS